MVDKRPRRWNLEEALALLKAHYPGLSRPAPTDLWEQILWENVAYLADDERRRAAFKELKAKVGTAPDKILKAPGATLVAISRKGILAGPNVEKLRECARIMMSDFGGDPRAMASLPTDTLRAALRKFPRIGAPGADRLLLFARREPSLALESNGVRVLLRLGFGREDPSYAKAYASLKKAMGALPADFDYLIEAHELLRHHGKTLCKRSNPACGSCPLVERCPTGIANVR